MARIKVRHLTKIYNEGQQNEVRALDDVSFTLEEGEFVVILGPSGAGKSTLLNILGGMDSASSGSYLVNEKDVAKFKEKELSKFRREDVGFLFQFYNLMPNLSCLENVEIAASLVEQPFDAASVLKDVGLEKRLSNFPSALSGGEQQRTAIARAIVKNPKLLLCDEPTGALDAKPGAAVLSLLLRVAKAYKKTVIMVTHNAKIADVAEHLLRIADGKLVADTKNEHPLPVEEISW